MNTLIKVLSFSAGLSSVAQAQELTLFEPVEAAPAVEQQAPQIQNLLTQNGQPAFTVRGTARIGSLYKVVLVDRSGQEKKVEWQAGQSAPVPGATGFAVSEISSRSVTLSHPATDPCVSSAPVGVSCTDTTTSVLSVATAAAALPATGQQSNAGQPVLGVVGPNTNNPNATPGANPFEAAIQAQQAAMQAGGAMPVPAGGGNAFVNPFSGQTQVAAPDSPELQQARDNRQRQRSERLGRFEAQRIAPDQVPPGMRVVSTPFGDRLVPAN
jgi:hypothetical protein